MSFPWNITNPGILIEGLLTSIEQDYVTNLVLASGSASEGEVLTWISGAPSWEPAAGGGSITVKEIDGTPNVTGVTTLRFSNGTLTDDGGGQVTITIGASISDGDKGDITVSGGGVTWTIDDDAVTYAKIQNVSTTDRLLGRDTAGAGNIEELSVTGGLEFTGSGGIQRSALTGAITASAGSNSTSLGSFTKAQLDAAVSDGNVLYVGDITQYTDELAQDAIGAMVDTTLVYNDATPLLSRAALTGAITASAGSNSTSLGSFTFAQLNTAISDADVANATHTHTLANITDVTITVANLNSLDDGVNSTLHFHDSDRNRANHTGTQLASTISDFNEAAQDAIGAMVDTTLVYTDGTPLLQRAALTGAITASAGSNSTSLGSFTKAQLDTAVSDGNVLYVGDITQYTDELAQDAVGAMVANSTFINLTYVDGTPSLTAALSATGTPSSTTFLRGDNTWATVTGGSNVYFNNIRYAQAGGTHSLETLSGAVNGSNTVFTVPGGVYVSGKLRVWRNGKEAVDGWTQTTPASGTFTFDVAPLTGDIITVEFQDQVVSATTLEEIAQDAVGTILVDSAEIDFTYNDGTPSITASIVAGSIDETKLDTSVNASLDLADSAVQENDSPTFGTVTLTTEIISPKIRASSSAGIIIEANNATDVVDFGVGNTANTTFYGAVQVPDDAYDATSWNGNTTVPTKNAIRDKIESLTGVTDGDKGDITVSAAGLTWTIDNDVVTNTKMANMATATIKGRTTAGTGDPEDLTAAQATALLDIFTSTLKGLAPASGGGTTNFLRADGTWAAPPGGGGGLTQGQAVALFTGYAMI